MAGPAARESARREAACASGAVCSRRRETPCALPTCALPHASSLQARQTSAQRRRLSAGSAAKTRSAAWRGTDTKKSIAARASPAACAAMSALRTRLQSKEGLW